MPLRRSKLRFLRSFQLVFRGRGGMGLNLLRGQQVQSRDRYQQWNPGRRGYDAERKTGADAESDCGLTFERCGAGSGA
jgi:hypothetical protein